MKAMKRGSFESIELLSYTRLADMKLLKRGIPGMKNTDERDEKDLIERGEEFGYPIMFKASAGGGGKGMR